MASQALSNFRDFGDLPTRAGARVVAGRMFRSANPGAGANPRLAERGIRAVVDLRGLSERALAPATHDEGVAVVPMPIEPGTASPLSRMLAEGTATHAAGRELMVSTYRAFVRVHAEPFGAAIETILASAVSHPVLVHCTAGKDRTGFLVALLQRALGVDDDLVLDDYLATNGSWDRASAQALVPTLGDAAEAVLIADADYLHAAFDEILAIDGDVTAFLARATRGRVTPDSLARLLEKDPLS